MSCQSGSDFSVTCVKKDDQAIMSCKCDKGDCSKYNKDHESQEVKEFVSNLSAATVVFLCTNGGNGVPNTSQNKDKKPLIIAMVTRKDSNMCDADFKDGKGSGLGDKANKPAKICSQVGFTNLLEGNIPAAAQARGATRDDIAAIKDNCFQPMKPECAKQLIDVMKLNDVDKQATSTDFTNNLVASCQGVTVESSDSLVSACASIAETVLLQNGSSNVQNISDINANMQSTVDIISAVRRRLADTTTTFRAESNDNLDKILDPTKVDIAGQIAIDGITTTKVASVTSFTTDVNTQSTTVKGASSSNIIISFAIILLGMLIVL
jgi:hypothetical protein